MNWPRFQKVALKAVINIAIVFAAIQIEPLIPKSEVGGGWSALAPLGVLILASILLAGLEK